MKSLGARISELLASDVIADVDMIPVGYLLLDLKKSFQYLSLLLSIHVHWTPAFSRASIALRISE